jgi:hypothetical protein
MPISAQDGLEPSTPFFRTEPGTPVAHVRSSNFETPTARLKLAVRKKPYKLRIARAIKLLYRRNEGVGTWSVEASDGHGRSWTRKFADADDHDKADDNSILTFWSAQDKCKSLARGKTSEGEGAPVTVSQALDDYEIELKNHGADPANAKRVRRHLSSTLAGKCVALLSVRDLRAFRDGLGMKGLANGGVNRTAKGLRAALNAAAAADPRITNNAAWRIGLAGLPVGDTARRMVLPDADVGRIVTAAYEINRPFGLYVEVLAVCGARASQVQRLTVGDLQTDHAARLMVPASRKGGRPERRRPSRCRSRPVWPPCCWTRTRVARPMRRSCFGPMARRGPGRKISGKCFGRRPWPPSSTRM